MSVFGKVLAFLNVLAVMALLVLTLLDYTQRQMWEYSALRHQLMIDGLPVDAEETTPEGRLKVDNLSDYTLKQIFKNRDIITTQKEEVARVQQNLTAKINGAPHLMAQIAGYCRVLLPMAITNAEREDLYFQIRRAEHYQKAYERTVVPLLPGEYQKSVPEKFEELLTALRGFPVPEAKANPAYPNARVLELSPLDVALSKLFLPALQKRVAADANLSAQVAAKKPFTPAQQEQLAVMVKDTFIEVLQAQAGKKIQEELQIIQDTYKKRFDETFQYPLAAERVVVVRDQTGKATTRVQKVAREDRRRAIARLLFNMIGLDPVPKPGTPAPALPGAAAPAAPAPGQPAQPQGPLDGPEYERFLTVVGLEVVPTVIEQEAQLIQEITVALEAERARELKNFAQLHTQVLDRVRQKAPEVYRLSEDLKRAKESREIEKDLVAKREANVLEWRKDLRTVRLKTAKALGELRGMTESLHKVRIQVRDALRLNQQYEKQIRDLEGVRSR